MSTELSIEQQNAGRVADLVEIILEGHPPNVGEWVDLKVRVGKTFCTAQLMDGEKVVETIQGSAFVWKP